MAGPFQELLWPWAFTAPSLTMVSLEAGADPGCSPEILLLRPENPLHLSDRTLHRVLGFAGQDFQGTFYYIRLWMYGETEAQQRQDPSQAEVGSRIHR